MKFHDYSAELGLSLVTDDDGSGWRYESIKPQGCAPLEATPAFLIRQGHCVANSVIQGLVIAGSRIRLKPEQWRRLGAEVKFKRAIGAMT